MPNRRILVSGSTGLIGSRVVADRAAAGDEVVPLVRRPAPPPAVPWDGLTPAAVSGFDAVVHLAGEPIAAGRWTAARKAAIRDSRSDGTTRLVAALAAAPRPPGVFVCASGINFYGDHGDAIVDETAASGESFLARACVEWEAAAAPLAGVCRVVHVRMGMVLSGRGGAMASILPAFRLGLGGPIAGGRRWVSWVTLDDTAAAISHVIDTDRLAGPVNVVAPAPATNAEFTRAVAAAVRRPAVLPIPGWFVRLAVGELADETVLTSLRAVPRRLLDDGFRFRHDRVGPAMLAVVAVP